MLANIVGKSPIGIYETGCSLPKAVWNLEDTGLWEDTRRTHAVLLAR